MNKIITVLAAFVFVAANFSSAFAVDAKPKAQQTTGNIAALLPASDAIVVADMKRLLNEAVPQMLGSKPQSLAEIDAHINAFKTKTGINPRQFERLAIGVKYNRISPTEIDFAPVAIARGNFNAAGLLSAARAVLNGEFREEKLGKRNLLVVSLKDVAAPMPQPADPAKAVQMNRLFSRLMTGEIALFAVDQNTLAFGDVKQVRAVADASVKSQINAELIALAAKNPNAVLSFAGNVPSDSMSLFRVDNDEFGRVIGSLRQMSGSLDFAAGNANAVFAARAENVEQARGLKDTLQGLQSLSGFLRMKGGKNQILADLAESVRISQTSNEVEMRLTVPQSSFGSLGIFF